MQSVIPSHSWPAAVPRTVRSASPARRPTPAALPSGDSGLVLFDHGHIQTGFHARLFKTGELCLPGRAPEMVAIRFLNFQFNVVQDRMDAVYTVLRNGQRTGEFFASAFRHLGL